MIKNTLILLAVTFSISLSLYAAESEDVKLIVDTKTENSEATTALHGEPCGEICADICGPFSPRIFDCMYTYCDSGNGGGTFACKRGEDPMNPVPPDNTKVRTINP